MIVVPSFGKWNHSAGRIFIRERIGTSLWCIVRIRNKPWYKSLVKPKYTVELRPEFIIKQS